MKKLFAIFLVSLLVLSLGACKPGNTTTDPVSTGEGSYEINWSNLPDTDVVGAWKAEDSVNDEYVLFTDDGKLRIVYGTVVFDASISYGVDGYGNKSAYTEGNYLYGQWTYRIDGDKLTIDYSEDETKVFNRTDYTPITLEAKADFVKNDELVGKWLNKAYGDSYEFTEDGYAIFRQKVEDGVYAYETEIKHAYTVDDDEITMYFYSDNSGEEVQDSATFSIDGTKILIGNNDYYLNGEGSPEVIEQTTAE